MSLSNVYQKGVEYCQNGEYQKALEVFSSIRVNSLGNFDESVVHHIKAMCYSHLGNLQKSIIEFDLAITYNPNYVKAHFDKGMTYFFYRNFGKKNLVQALLCFEQGILVEAEHSECWYYRGYILELLGREAEASKSYKKSKSENFEGSELFKQVNI